jgi:beta-lactamase class A
MMGVKLYNVTTKSNKNCTMQNNSPHVRRAYLRHNSFPAQTYRPMATRSESLPKPLGQPTLLDKQGRSWGKLLVLPLILVIAGVIIFKAPVFSTDSKGDHHLLAASVPTQSLKPLDPVNTNILSEKLNYIINQHPELQVSISFVDIKTGATLHSGVSAPYVAASTAKLLTASLYLHQTEQGAHSLQEVIEGSSAKDQLKAMIVDSDNTAWSNLNQLLGDTALNQYAGQVGLTSYSHYQNTTTSNDIATLLTELYNHRLLNAPHAKLLLSYMQNASEADFIPAAVPAGTNVYHKAGYLNDRAHDAAIIDDSQRPFALVIFTKINSGSYDFQAGEDLMHQIATTTIDQVKKAE